MVTAQEVERQLNAVGVKRSFIIHAEIRELRHVLVPGELVQFCIAGRYEGGFAMLCATDQRVLLIDKKPMYLTMEDIRYDMVSEVDFSSRLLDSNVRICTPNKDLRFRSLSGSDLRKMTTYIQQRIMEFRQQHMMQPAFDPLSGTAPAPQPIQQQFAEQPVVMQPEPVQQPAETMQQLIPSKSVRRRYLRTSAPQPEVQMIQQAQPIQPAPVPAPIAAPANPVSSLPHHVVNPYLKVPLMMRRRVSRFPSM